MRDCRLDGVGMRETDDDAPGVRCAQLTDDNRWINAQRIEVSGGQVI